VDSLQVPISELLLDPVYRKWLKTPPVGGWPDWTKWRVYAQVKEGGGWAKKDFNTFVPAYNFLARNVKEWHDAALVCRNKECRPPVVYLGNKRQYHAPVLSFPGHVWCPYCRRPTVFGFYTKHHAFSGMSLDPMPDRKRCGICGISETAIKVYRIGALSERT
jgi:hypothetical protein